MYTVKSRVYWIRSFFVLLATILFFIGTTAVASAQIGIPGGETILTTNPETPQALRPFVARVEAYAYDINRATITWSIDGTPVSEYAGQQEISLTAPTLGTPLQISVRVVEQSGLAHTVSRTIIPSAIDIIVESETQIPNFYRGRSLPSPGGTIRLIAFPSIYTSNGAVARTQNLIYTWKINSQVVKSGVGMNVLTTTMPRSDTPLVELTAETSDGLARHTGYLQITPREPRIIFYEENPLHGLSRNALPSDITLLSEEISVRAEPYFMSKSIFENAQYGWNINGVPAENLNDDPQTITLRRSGSTGSTQIDFSIRNLKSLLQSATSRFTIHFN